MHAPCLALRFQHLYRPNQDSAVQPLQVWSSGDEEAGSSHREVTVSYLHALHKEEQK